MDDRRPRRVIHREDVVDDRHARESDGLVPDATHDVGLVEIMIEEHSVEASLLEEGDRLLRSPSAVDFHFGVPEDPQELSVPPLRVV